MYAFIFKLYAVIKILSYDVAVVFDVVAIPCLRFYVVHSLAFGFTWPLIGC